MTEDQLEQKPLCWLRANVLYTQDLTTLPLRLISGQLRLSEAGTIIEEVCP